MPAAEATPASCRKTGHYACMQCTAVHSTQDRSLLRRTQSRKKARQSQKPGTGNRARRLTTVRQLCLCTDFCWNWSLLTYHTLPTGQPLAGIPLGRKTRASLPCCYCHRMPKSESSTQLRSPCHNSRAGKAKVVLASGAGLCWPGCRNLADGTQW